MAKTYDLGAVTAYAIAKEHGYEGTLEQFAAELTGATDAARAAAQDASDAEAYAIGKRGGVDVGETDPTYHNNAKYYKDFLEIDYRTLKEYPVNINEVVTRGTYLILTTNTGRYLNLPSEINDGMHSGVLLVDVSANESYVFQTLYVSENNTSSQTDVYIRRTIENMNFSEWTKANINYGVISESTDFNNLKNTGVYSSSNLIGTYINAPDMASGDILIVTKIADNNVKQTVLSSSGACYFRLYSNNNWGQWNVIGIRSSILSRGTDFNNVKETGWYSLYVQIDSNMYLNGPSDFVPGTRAILLVICSNQSRLYPSQIIIYSDGRYYYRKSEDGGNTWTSWNNKYADLINSVNNSIENLKSEIPETIILTKGTDFNNVITDGKNLLFTQSDSNPYLNGPDDFITGVSGTLIVTVDKLHPEFIKQIIIYDSGKYYTRNSMNSGNTWSNWNNYYNIISDSASKIDIFKKNLLGIFHTIGVVGDSLASGQGRINDYSHMHDFFDYSWPQCMSRILGNTVYNFTTSGLSTRTWLTHDHGYTLASDGNHKCQCYIIGLGANDIELGQAYLGSPNDIDVNDYNNNADTYYGNYAKIISLLREIEPRCIIFTVENPSYGNNTLRPMFNSAVRYMSTIFDNVYNIIPDDTLYNSSGTFINKNRVAGHYTPAAYLFMAEYLIDRMSDVIYKNPSDFYFVNLIGTEYATPVN